MYTAAVVIPIYKTWLKLSDFEHDSFVQGMKILQNRDIYAVCPESLDMSGYEAYGVQIRRIDDRWFIDRESYSELCKKVWFYEMFKDYDYMMIYQLDAWIFEDRLDYFMNMGYDWYGAPHLFKDGGPTNGNGGFNLRRISKMIEVCSKVTDFTGMHWSEDIMFTRDLKHYFDIAPVEIAFQFSFQRRAKVGYAINGKVLPMGCHRCEYFSRQWWARFIPALNKVAVAALVDRENQYLYEWVEHYKALGVDRIIIWDKSQRREDRAERVLWEYIKTGFVEVNMCENIRHHECFAKVYDALTTINHSYSWVGFLGTDEFLEIDDFDDIHDWLNQEQFRDCDAVAVNWKLYDDNGLISNDGRPLQERFTHAIPDDTISHDTGVRFNDYCKCFVRTGNYNLNWKSRHTCHHPDGWPIHIVDVEGKGCRCRNGLKRMNHNGARLKHYMYKTIDEFIHGKLERYPIGDRPDITFGSFFNVNKRTKEKEDYARIHCPNMR